MFSSALRQSLLPEIIAERCVHSRSEIASCKSCVDSCPRQAWVLNDEQLGLATDRCDGCGLCASACSEAAIVLENVEPFSGVTQDIKTVFAACEKAALNNTHGVMPCLQALSLRDILSYYRRGYQQWIVCRDHCDQCPRGAVNHFFSTLQRLNELLLQRALPPIRIEEQNSIAWMKLYRASEPDKGPVVSRRNFFRKAALDLLDTGLEMVQATDQPAKTMAAPGKLLPSASPEGPYFFLPEINPAQCNACHACARMCPHEAIVLDEETPGYRFNHDNCTGCSLCADNCDQSALEIVFWSKAEKNWMPLHKQTCRSCGSRYYSPAIADKSEGAGNCHICKTARHHSRLYQVLST
jgi:Pyruvate/2-oxoacid:ferredoxin oxidoreductase delta subunit